MTTQQELNHDFDKKYVPTVFSELIGVEYLAPTLKRLVQRRNPGSLAFMAPNGYGKSTIAHIFIKTILCRNPNGLDACGSCESCRDPYDYMVGDFVCILGTEYVHYLKRLSTELCYAGRTLARKGVFADDLDAWDYGDLIELKDLMNKYPSNSFVATISNTAALPNPLRQRFRLLPIRKWGKEEGTALVRHVCEREHITIESDVAVAQLLRLTEFNPRLILRTLDLVQTEGGILAGRVLASPVISECMSVQSGIRLNVVTGSLLDDED